MGQVLELVKNAAGRMVPTEVNGVKTSDSFPDWPRILLKYIGEKIKPSLVKEITKLSLGESAKYVF